MPTLRALFPCVFLLAFALPGATPPARADAIEVAAGVREWREAHEQQIVDEFAGLLAIPNVASDTVNIRRNAEHIRGLLEQRGLDVELLEVEGSPPVVFAERRVPGADTTLMIYVHYDGQPVNAADWASDPWMPVLRTDLVENGGQERPMQAPFDPSWRIFARSAGDDKAPIVALTSALDALEANGIPLGINLKLFFDGEEEAGSPHIIEMLTKYRDRLDADLWLICDGPRHQSKRWQLVYGVRGAYGFDLTTYGPNRPLHSGHYGNWAPNPAVLLMELLGSMRAPDGRVLVEGINQHVRPLTEAERAAVAAMPDVGPRLITELGIGQPETEDRLDLAVLRPAINIRGIRYGDVGAQARNSILPSATASVGLRLVPDLTPENLREAITTHIEQQGFTVVHDAPTAEQRRDHSRIARVEWEQGGYPAYRTSLTHPVAQRISAMLERLSDGTLLQTPTMGGSLPLAPISDAVGAPILILPIANHDNNQHGANENLVLQNLWDGIEIYAALLATLE